MIGDRPDVVLFLTKFALDVGGTVKQVTLCLQRDAREVGGTLG